MSLLVNRHMSRSRQCLAHASGHLRHCLSGSYRTTHCESSGLNYGLALGHIGCPPCRSSCMVSSSHLGYFLLGSSGIVCLDHLDWYFVSDLLRRSLFGSPVIGSLGDQRYFLFGSSGIVCLDHLKWYLISGLLGCSCFASSVTGSFDHQGYFIIGSSGIILLLTIWGAHACSHCGVGEMI